MESNDSPEIPDRGETSDIPGLPSGDWMTALQWVKHMSTVSTHLHVLFSFIVFYGIFNIYMRALAT